jgi:hypothetical protein
MIDLSKLMFIIIESLILIYSCKLLIDWSEINRYSRENAEDKLMKMQHARIEWISRHMGCALLAIIMIVAIKIEPTLQWTDHLTEVMAAYAAISMFFAFTESILMQRIAVLVRK